MPVVEALRAAYSDGDVLVVCHKATIRILVCVLLGVDVDRYRDRVACPVGSMTTFAFAAGDDPLLLALGDVSHLPARLRSPGGRTTRRRLTGA